MKFSYFATALLVTAVVTSPLPASLNTESHDIATHGEKIRADDVTLLAREDDNGDGIDDDVGDNTTVAASSTVDPNAAVDPNAPVDATGAASDVDDDGAADTQSKTACKGGACGAPYGVPPCYRKGKRGGQPCWGKPPGWGAPACPWGKKPGKGGKCY